MTRGTSRSIAARNGSRSLLSSRRGGIEGDGRVVGVRGGAAQAGEVLRGGGHAVSVRPYRRPDQPAHVRRVPGIGPARHHRADAAADVGHRREVHVDAVGDEIPRGRFRAARRRGRAGEGCAWDCSGAANGTLRIWPPSWSVAISALRSAALWIPSVIASSVARPGRSWRTGSRRCPGRRGGGGGCSRARWCRRSS